MSIIKLYNTIKRAKENMIDVTPIPAAPYINNVIPEKIKNIAVIKIVTVNMIKFLF